MGIGVKFNFEKDLDKVLSEAKRIVCENKYSKGINLTIKLRYDENPTIDYTVEDKIVKLWEE
jgi:hypothetical protein